MTVHDPDCGCDTYGCQLRRKGLDFSYNATPTRRSRRPYRPKVGGGGWEAGKSGEHRTDGSFMPYIGDKSGRTIPTKEFSERRRQLTDARDRQIKGPAPQE